MGWGVGEVWSLTCQSLPHVNFQVDVLEFASKLKEALDSLKKILDTGGTLYVVQ